MKKLLFAFSLLLCISILSACGNRDNTLKFDDETSNGEIQTEEKEVDEKTWNEDSAAPQEQNVDGEGEVIFLTEPNNEPTSQDYHVIRGTVPRGTHSVKVNDYALHLFRPGQKEWSYIASAKMGTLKEGENLYEVSALDLTGKAIDSQTYRIDYAPAPTPMPLPRVGMSLWITLALSTLLSSVCFTFTRLVRKPL